MNVKADGDVNGTAELAGAILDALAHPVVLIDNKNRLKFANQPAEQFLRSSRAFIEKQTLDYFLPFGSPVIALVEQVRKTGSRINEYRVDISSPRLGNDFLVDVYAMPFPAIKDGVTLEFLQRSMAEKLDRQLTHRSAARSVSGLAAMLAHEIKNPLSGIRGAAQLLEMNASTDEKQLTRLIRDETDRIVGLVDRMEVFSDARPVEKTPVNIHAVLEHVRRIAVSGFGAKVHFEELYDPSLPPISANRDQLVQVMLNLVKNAVEACIQKKKPTITVTTAYRPGVHVSASGNRERIAVPVEICIRDNGSGIAEDIRAHIFDPFVTSKVNGSGLGLALVAKIIGDHGGVIECDSGGAGSCFRILLPVYREAENRREPA